MRYEHWILSQWYEWVSDTEIHLNLSLMSSYPSQITLYKSLYICWQSILESTIGEISYLGSLLIITSVETGYVLLRKELDVVGLNIDT